MPAEQSPSTDKEQKSLVFVQCYFWLNVTLSYPKVESDGKNNSVINTQFVEEVKYLHSRGIMESLLKAA